MNKPNRTPETQEWKSSGTDTPAEAIQVDARRIVLISGATGYIGRRLKSALLDRSDLSLRLMVRNRNKVSPDILGRVQVVEADTFKPETLDTALYSVHTAFYLIHSMGAGRQFESLDRLSATHFRDACIRAGVKRIIYLGGLGTRETASSHLLSRIETGEILSAKPGEIQVIWFRAGIIIGSGSASFEIIRNLVQKLPLMITPRWVTTLTQPVAVDDVITYLSRSIDLNISGNTIVDIGSEPLTFRQMMLRTATAMGLSRKLIPVPVLSPALSSYWLILFTPIPFQMASALVQGLKSETIIQNTHAADLFPEITPMGFEDAIKAAVKEIENSQVISRWCDSSAGATCDIKAMDDTSEAVFRDERRFPLDGISRDRVFSSVCSLGGDTGWLALDNLWRIRGLMDKIQGGYGLTRGRRDRTRLRIGDALDFWKVVDLKQGRRLLLGAQMAVPGKAWLEFDIQDDALIQTAHFYPRGLLGRIYWAAMLPFHAVIFNRLGRRILQASATPADGHHRQKPSRNGGSPDPTTPP